MIKDLENIEVGDILGYVASGEIGQIIDLLTPGNKVHVSTYIGDGTIIESHIETGVVEKILNPKWFPYITVYGWKDHLTDEEKDAFVKELKKAVGWKYNLVGFVPTFFRSVIGQMVKCPWLMGLKQLVGNDRDSAYCSELLMRITRCRWALKRNRVFRPDLSPRCGTPDDVTDKNPLLYIKEK